MFIYIQKMILDIIETLQTSIYSPKHTENTKIHDHICKCFKESVQIYIPMFVFLMKII
jgi:hypothetical protein